MKKNLFLLIVLLPFLWGCNHENEQQENAGKSDTSSRAIAQVTSSGLGVDSRLLFLQSDTIKCAGKIVITANVPEVTLVWNVQEEANLDATLTHLEVVDGQAVLDINWAKKRADGNFAPKATAFDNGVRISDGTTSIYVHLILTKDPVAEDFDYLSSIPSTATPAPNFMQITPSTLALTESEGGIAKVTLTGTAPIQVQTDKLGSFTKLNFSLIPETMEEDGDNLEIPFKWQTTAPDANFKVSFSIYSYDTNLVAEADVAYFKQSESFLVATPSIIEISDAGGRVSTKIETNQDKWVMQNVSDIPEWLTCGETEGYEGTSVLNLTVAVNQSVQPRSHQLVLKAGEAVENIHIIQSGLVPTLDIMPASFPSIKAEGGNVTANVNSNVAWMLSDNLPTWIHPNVKNGSGSKDITFTIDPYVSFEPRTATISISETVGTTPIKKNITFTQQAREFKVTPALFSNVSAKGENITMNIVSNVAWKIANDVPTWVHPKAQSGTGNGTIALTIDENTTFAIRTAVVKVVTKVGTTEVSREVKITQGARIFTVSPGSFPTIDPEGGKMSVNVSSNVDWELSGAIPSWVHPNVKSGSDNGGITFSIDANNTPTSRSESVEIISTIGGTRISRTVTFTQQEIKLTISPTSYPNISANGEVMNLSVTSNVSWQISGNLPNWLHSNVQLGSGNTTIVFTADANTASKTRSATVTLVTLTGTTPISRQVIFTQKADAPRLTVSQNSFTSVSQSGKTLSVNIASNVSWKVINDNSWIEVTPNNGTGNQDLAIIVARNLGLSKRTGSITIQSTNTTGEVITKTITIQQKGFIGVKDE